MQNINNKIIALGIEGSANKIGIGLIVFYLTILTIIISIL